jgi:osmotically-inducible protein OsmY
MNALPVATGMRALRAALAELRIDELHIESVGGVVHLHGVAPCYRAKRQAEECCQSLMPGPAVNNHLRVAERAYVDDPAIERDVRRRLAALGGSAPSRVTIEVRGAVVSLYGQVVDEEERRQLREAATTAACVRGIEDHLMLASLEPADTEVAGALGEYVCRAMNLPPGVVNVTWRSGLATLTGSVATETQRQAIEELVLWHDHVSDVVNRIRIVSRLGTVTPASRLRPGDRAP